MNSSIACAMTIDSPSSAAGSACLSSTRGNALKTSKANKPGIVGQELRKFSGVPRLFWSRYITTSQSSLHGSEQVTFSALLCTCHEVIVKASDVVGELAIKFHAVSFRITVAPGPCAH